MSDVRRKSSFNRSFSMSGLTKAASAAGEKADDNAEKYAAALKEVEDLKTERDGLKETVETLKGASGADGGDGLQEKVEELTLKCNSQEKELAKVKELEEKVAQMQSVAQERERRLIQLEDMEKKAEALTAERDELKAELEAKLQEMTEEHAKAMAAMTEKHDSALQVMSEQHDAAIASTEKLHELHTSAADSHNELNQNLQSSQEKLAAATAKLEVATAEKAALTTESQDLKKQLDDLQTTNLALTDLLEKAQGGTQNLALQLKVDHDEMALKFKAEEAAKEALKQEVAELNGANLAKLAKMAEMSKALEAMELQETTTHPRAMNGHANAAPEKPAKETEYTHHEYAGTLKPFEMAQRDNAFLRNLLL